MIGGRAWGHVLEWVSGGCDITLDEHTQCYYTPRVALAGVGTSLFSLSLSLSLSIACIVRGSHVPAYMMYHRTSHTHEKVGSLHLSLSCTPLAALFSYLVCIGSSHLDVSDLSSECHLPCANQDVQHEEERERRLEREGVVDRVS